MKKRHNTIQQKLCETTARISITIMLCVFILCIGIFSNFYIQVEKNNSHMRLDYMSSKLETLCYTVENYSTTILTNAYIQQLLVQEEIGPMEQLNYTQFVLNYVTPSIGFHSISLYDTDYHLIITSTNLAYSKSELAFSNEDANSNNVYYQFTTSYDSKSKEYVPVLSMSRPIYSSSAKLLGYIEVCITEEELLENYISYAADNTITYLVDSNNVIQSSNDKNAIGLSYYNDGSIFTKLYMEYDFPTYSWTLVEQLTPSNYIFTLLSYLSFPIFIVITFLLFLVVLIRRKLNVILSPLNDLIQQMNLIQKGDWKTIPNDSEYDDIILLFDSFNKMIIEQERLKDDLLETESLKNELSLNLLQEQVQPHFLYNTLENICSLAEVGETELLIKTVMNLSEFYRVSLSDGKVFITIEEELIIIKSYLEIMQTRYFNRFSFDIKCPDTLKKEPCIRLLLQPIIENCIYHGIKNSNQYGYININVFEENEYIIITIKDNGTGIPHEKLSQILNEQHDSFGLYSINTRIKCYYNDACGMHIANNPAPDKGVTVTVQITKSTAVSDTITE